MKRNFTLLRRILLDVEALPAGQEVSEFKCDDFDSDTVTEHVRLLFEGNLIDGMRTEHASGMDYSVSRLTWAGHDFLAKAKNDTIWKKVIAHAEEKGSSVPFSILDALLTKAAEKHLGLE